MSAEVDFNDTQAAHNKPTSQWDATSNQSRNAASVAPFANAQKIPGPIDSVGYSVDGMRMCRCRLMSLFPFAPNSQPDFRWCFLTGGTDTNSTVTIYDGAPYSE
jgi:hypothetical protein